MKAIITNESKDNNPSPLEDFIEIDKMCSDYVNRYSVGISNVQYEKLYTNVKQALNNYANMVEMLEGIIKEYEDDKKLYGSTIAERLGYDCYEDLVKDLIADITKVLEGKK
jgi:hypothetical protein